MTGQNARTTALAAGAVAIIGLLSGCATPAGRGSSATITYEVDGQQKTTAFAPSNVTCNDRGAVSLSFPDKPFNGVSLSRGSTDTVEAWVYGDELIFFTSESVTVTQATDDGATTYVVSGQAGEVAVAALAQGSPDTPPDVDAAISNAVRYAGRLDLTLRCDPES